MRSIAILVQSSQFGGVQRVIRNLANGLASLGHQIAILSCDDRGGAFDAMSSSVSVVDFAVRGSHGDGKVAMAIPQIRSYVKRFRPDVLLAAPGLSGQFALVSANGTRTRVVVMIDNRISIVRAKSVMHRVAYGMGARLYRRASAIVLAHDSALEDFRRCVPCCADKATRIYHPLIPDNLSSLVAEEPDFVLPDSGRLIVAAGRFVPEKDFSTLLRAFSLLDDEAADIRLLILGEGKLRSDLECEARNLNITSHVLMPGAVTNVYKYFSRADVFVLTSVSEAFGNVLIEALASGCPVVATRCESGGPQEILANGRYGELCKQGDAEGIASALLRVLRGKGVPTREELSSRGSEFSVAESCRQYSRLIEGLV